MTTALPSAFYPSTTRILDFWGFYRSMEKARPSNMEIGRNQGSGVDKLTTWLAMGHEPPWSSDATREYFAPWADGVRKFFREHTWTHHSHQNEFVCTIKGMEFISHPDNLGVLDGALANLEVKKGVWPEFVRLQTAGQIIAEGNRSRQRFVLNLPAHFDRKRDKWIDHGRYRLIHLVEPRDLDDFTALAQGWWAKNEPDHHPTRVHEIIIQRAQWVCERYKVAA